jgi:hypothetical protein
MALATDPTYSTYAQFKTYSPVAAQRGGTPAEADWEIFALRAEKIIDTYVNIPENQRYETDQDLAFPIIDSNGASLIPDDVTLAHIHITSDLILKGDAVSEDGLQTTGETWSNSQYSKNKQKKSQSSSDDVKIQMPAFARRLLQPWTDAVSPFRY